MNHVAGSRVWLEIDLTKLRENAARIRQAVAPCGVIAVLKANAYGLGVVPIARTLATAGVAGFAVAEPDEALQLVDLGLPVQILGGMLEHELPHTVAAGLIHPIVSLDVAERISAEAARQKKTVECHLLIDTGMGRLGILAAEALDTIDKVMALPNLDCAGVYSHFPMAYRAGEAYTQGQIDLFLTLLNRLEARGVTFRKIHIANSDAVNNFPRTCQPPFNFVRTGINLHGSFDAEGHRALSLEPILTLKARLVQIRTMPAGAKLGYGLTHTLTKETVVGTVAAGYADGLPLALSNRGHLLINDHLCPVLGRVSMDYVTVSLAGVPNPRVGDEVICLGGGGRDQVAVDTWADLKGTHAYDIICSFGSRVERKYM
ncbi:MAG: alanine racemase [Lentisphaeria bacterium]|nr:alanine racemase [Lentisphaeria bacterium]